MSTEATKLQGEFMELGQGRQREIEARYGEPACQCKELHLVRVILVEILLVGRVKRIIMMKKWQRLPLPANDLDYRPCVTPPLRIERPVYTSRNLWRETGTISL